ncbi:hypothetical protein [Corynebacterium sp. 13CS0277]|uniref:hypothetical protein n=1 Tax=Corynebacterium sp. 13CS0277 TaxID=2071994 RepID=UPI0011B28A33|nr:hypothetical protein [Corynebacterium sp. 13CS0277]
MAPKRTTARAAAGGALLCLALGLVSCAELSKDLAFGDIEHSEQTQVTVTLGHLDDQDRYLVVCPETTAKQLARTLGTQAPAKYPEDGYTDRSALVFLTPRGETTLRTYALDRFDLCKSSNAWEVTDITQPLKLTKDEKSGAWYASPVPAAEATANTGTVVN